MSYVKATWWRPAAGALVALAIAALWLVGAGQTHAGNGGNVVITPASVEVGEGGSTTVTVDLTAPPSGLSIWIVQIAYDPDVVQMVNGNDDCTTEMLDFPGGVAGAAGCATKDTNSNQENDTAVAFGGWVENDGGTAIGFTGTKTVASFTFEAVGSVGEDSPLTVTVTSFLGPNAEENVPGEADGLITIIEQQGVSEIWGDINCSGSITLADAIGIARFLVSLPLTPDPPADCPDMGAAITVAGNAQMWGDLTCSSGVGLGDAIGVARFLVSLAVTQTQPCPGMNTNVDVIVS